MRPAVSECVWAFLCFLMRPADALLRCLLMAHPCAGPRSPYATSASERITGAQSETDSMSLFAACMPCTRARAAARCIACFPSAGEAGPISGTLAKFRTAGRGKAQAPPLRRWRAARQWRWVQQTAERALRLTSPRRSRWARAARRTLSPGTSAASVPPSMASSRRRATAVRSSRMPTTPPLTPMDLICMFFPASGGEPCVQRFTRGAS